MPPKLFENHYARLGVSFDATPQEIRRAYHEAAKRLHPDTNASEGATDQFLRIQEAFDVLSDPNRRTSYDRTLNSAETAAAMRVSVLYSRSTLTRTAEPQLFYALVRIDPQAKPETDVEPPVNVCLVIDRSTSMQGKRMEMVKSTASRVLKQLRPSDVVSVITFSDRAEAVIEASRDRDPKKTDARISLIQTGGGTEIFHGLREGYQQVLRYNRSSSVNHIILITDGHTYGDEEKCLDLAEKIRASGITISALGIGTEWNEKFLDRLTSRTGGSVVFASMAKDIKRFLELKFTGLHRTFAENLRLEMAEVEPGVTLKYAFRVEPDPSRLEVGDVIPLGHMLQDEPVRFLLEFILQETNSLPESGVLLQAAIRCEVPGREIPSVRVGLRMAVPLSEDGTATAPPQEIIQAMSKLTLYRLQEQARADLDAGDFETATRRLRHLATHILASGEGELASTIMKEVDRLESRDRRTQQLEKSIMFGTRTLIAPGGTKTR